MSAKRTHTSPGISKEPRQGKVETLFPHAMTDQNINILCKERIPKSYLGSFFHLNEAINHFRVKRFPTYFKRLNTGCLIKFFCVA